MTISLRDLERRLARLEGMFYRGYTVSPAIPVTAPESVVTDEAGLPGGELAQQLGLPGSVVYLPLGCNVLVARVAQGQDPVILAGTGTLAAIAAIKVLAAAHPEVLTGGLIIADPVAAATAIVITPSGGDLVGNWTLNGVGIPT
ncbi:hypothetical protein [Zavarzinia sp.]|uniref:hypothetical protein n=1 Tax=Zavarzinia sp. TaxID=2027920 RepID=UPI00356213FE